MISKLLLLVFSFSLLNVAISAQERIVPILEMKLGGLIGGVQNGRFVDAKTTFARLKGKNAYTIYGVRGKTGEMTTEIEPPDVPCDDFYFFKSEMENLSGIAVGANPGWNPAPRVVKTMDVKNSVYIKAASDALLSKGIVNKNPKIREAFRVDLEGDGQEEVLLTVTSYGDNITPRAAKGDYSFVMLRKIVGGKVQNIIIAGEIIKKTIEFGAPSKYEISSIADLNGDGKMEIIIFSAYYEGNSAGVYEMKGNKPVEVKPLGSGCGV
jgi:hypothetical protein